jgi:hypothetical protein
MNRYSFSRCGVSVVVALALVGMCSVTVAAASERVSKGVREGVTSNINGYYVVREGLHYANKSSVLWGESDAAYFSVQVSE